MEDVNKLDVQMVYVALGFFIFVIFAAVCIAIEDSSSNSASSNKIKHDPLDAGDMGYE